MKTTLGDLETRLLAYTQMRRLRSLKQGDMTKALRITPTQERYLLSRMAGARLITRVRRGLYLVPPRLPLGGTWSPDEILALDTLISDRGGTYQICGPNCFNRYGFDEQIPTRIYAYNNRLSGDRDIGSVALTLIKVTDDRLGDTEEAKPLEGPIAIYSSRTRSLMDAVHDWSRFDTLPRAYEWIKTELAAKRVAAQDLANVTVRYANKGTIRRIGALLEREGVKGKPLQTLESSLNGSDSPIAWVPNRPRRGTTCSRWGVILNG